MISDRPKDILQVEPNRVGRDFVIGDIHGSDSALKAVLDKLQPHDRLFIVGDLTDKGENSAAIVGLINEKRTENAIYAVKGNHEEMCLGAVKIIDQIKLGNEITEKEKLFLFDALYNSGEWIFENEYFKKSLRQHIKKNKPFTSLKKIIEFIDHHSLQDEFIKQPLISNINEITNYMQLLPYIIRVGNKHDKDAFIVCHADLPMTDDELDEMISDSHLLQDDTKLHITWARSNEIQKKAYYRDEASTRVYCGHNIIGHHGTVAVRKDTNTINLDGGAFITGQFILLNHTENKAELIGEPKPEVDFETINNLNTALASINNYMKNYHQDPLVLLSRNIIDQLKKFGGNNPHPGQEGINNLIDISNRSISNKLKRELIQQECKDRTSSTSTIQGFLRNSFFLHKFSRRTDEVDLLYHAIAEQELNMNFVNRNSKCNITTLEQLIIAQQKRQAIATFKSEINRLNIPVVGTGLYGGGDRVFPVSPCAHAKIASYIQLIDIVRKSRCDQPLNDILDSIFDNKSHPIKKSLYATRGFGITAVTSATVIDDLRRETMDVYKVTGNKPAPIILQL